MILRTKSYVVFEDIPLHLHFSIISYGKEKNFKCLFSKNAEETENFCKKAVHLLGIYYGSGKENKNDLILIEERSVFVTGDDLSSIIESEQIDHVTKTLNQSLHSLVPNSLKDLSQEAFKHISKELMGLDIETEMTVERPHFTSQCLVSCESVGESLSHYVSFEFESYADFKGIKSNAQLLDLFREIANQTLGVINNHLVEVPIYSRIGLPYVMDPYDIDKNTIKTSYYYPKVIFKSEDKKLIITFGYLSIDKKLPNVGCEVKKTSSFEIF